MDKLLRSYLLFATLFFSFGLIGGVYFNSILFIAGLTLISCSLILIFSKLFALRYQFFFAGSFFVLGMMFMQSRFPLENELFEVDEESFFIAKIDEQLRQGLEWETDIITVESILGNEGWKPVDEKILMLCESSSELLKAGDRIMVKSKFHSIKNYGNPGEFNAENYWISKGVRYQCFGFVENVKLIEVVETPFLIKVLNNVRAYSVSVISKFVDEKSRGLAQAILLGDKSNLDLETKNAFTNAGAIHVLAVSGLHVGIIAYLLNAIFQFIFKGNKRKIGVIMILLILWFYAFITGFSPSVTRAVLMFSILIGAQLFSRNYNSINSLALAALILLVWNPLYLFDPGFQLSFLAMFGIFMIYEKLEGLFYIRNSILKKVWQGTAVGLAAQIFTVPLSLFLFFQFPNYFILSNLGVMLLANIILGGGIALVAFGTIPFINVCIGWVLSLAILGLIVIVDWVQELPGAVAYGFQPSLTWTLFAYVLILAVLYFLSHKKKRWKFALIIMISVVFLQWNRFENLHRSEVCVFNTNHPTVLINGAGEQICLYSGEEDGYLKAKLLVANYNRIHPGKTKFVEIERNKLNIRSTSNTISVNRQRYYMDIVINKSTFRLITSGRHWIKNEAIDEAHLISAPYLSNELAKGHLLSSGAFQIQLAAF